MRIRLVGIGALFVLPIYACEDSPASTPVAPDAATLDLDGGTTTPVDAAGGTDATDAADAPVDTRNVLIATIDNGLYSVDMTTGALQEMGTTTHAALMLGWDDVAKITRVIVDRYSPLNGDPTPKLGTLDLCTGTVTVGPPITLQGAQVRRVEGIVQDPSTGTFWLTYGIVGPAEFLTESTGTVDVTTGAVTAVGNHATTEGDGDGTTFVDDVLYMVDNAATTGQGFLYTVNKANAQVTQVVSTGTEIRRIAYDPTRKTMYAAGGTGAIPNVTNRFIASLDIKTGQRTPLTTVPETTKPGIQFAGFMSAPKPVCP